MDENQETPESRDESMEVDQTVEKQDSTPENKDAESWKPPTADEIRCVQVLPFFSTYKFTSHSRTHPGILRFLIGQNLTAHESMQEVLLDIQISLLFVIFNNSP